MPRTCAGFSLIELVISITIITIAYVMMFGAGSKYGQTRSKAACSANLAQMYMALSLYAAEHNGAFPTQAGATSSEAPLSELVPRYTTDTSIFICPGSRTSALPGAQPFADRRISYAYYMGLTRTSGPDIALASDAQADLQAKRKGEALFSTTGSGPGCNHRGYGGNVLFVDGHVETGDALAPRDLPIPTGAVLLNPKS
jgi:prepilin-type processing-associated H-X9-DG protein/prepilin-type N-terminal cleavage/methylation domain-containing protein